MKHHCMMLAEVLGNRVRDADGRVAGRLHELVDRVVVGQRVLQGVGLRLHHTHPLHPARVVDQSGAYGSGSRDRQALTGEDE